MQTWSAELCLPSCTLPSITMRRPCHGSWQYKEEERHVGQNEVLSAERFGIELLNAKSPLWWSMGSMSLCMRTCIHMCVCACFWVCISVYERQAGRQKEVGERKRREEGMKGEGKRKVGREDPCL